jgi:hypothetical protein
LERAGFLKQDLVLRVYMTAIHPQVWRRFRVGAGTRLDVFVDKVLMPVMGWCRHYHSYKIVDQSDGAQFGPSRSTSIDMMHLPTNGWLFINDRTVRLGQLLQKPGHDVLSFKVCPSLFLLSVCLTQTNTMNYKYDLGDGWLQMIELEEVVAAEQSNGAVVVLDGAMACPPEDSNGCEGMGNRSYAKEVDKLRLAILDSNDDVAVVARRFMQSGDHAEMRSSMNWKQAGGPTHPMDFDPVKCSAALKLALASKASNSSGQKTFSAPLFGGGSSSNAALGAGMLGGVSRGESVNVGLDGLVEKVSISRNDRKADALCEVCGSCNNLKACARCRAVWCEFEISLGGVAIISSYSRRYLFLFSPDCSSGCQKLGWKDGHKDTCVRPIDDDLFGVSPAPTVASNSANKNKAKKKK